MFLTDTELERLTRRKQPAAQARVLREAGIYFRMVDKRPVVSRDELSQADQPPEPKLRLVR